MGVGLGAWLLSRLLGVDELGMAAMGVAGLVTLAVIHTRLASARLHAHRGIHPARISFQSEAKVEVEIQNAGRLPSAAIHVRDRLPAAFAAQPRFALEALASGETLTLSYTLTGTRRGRFRLGPMELLVRDPSGVAARRDELALPGQLTVYPPVWRLPDGLPLGGRRNHEEGGRTQPRRSGDEVATVREYVRGDDLRKVHWRTTAHRGKLMVRQDEGPRSRHATIVLDRRAGAHRGTGEDASFETAVAAAASAGYHLAERRFELRLMTGADDPGAGPLPWEALLEQLATVRTSPSADLAGLWRGLRRDTAAGGVLIAVTARPDAEGLRHMVGAGRGFGVRIALLLDTATFAGRPPREDSHRTLAPLRAAGWRAGVVRAGDRLDDRWAELVAQRHRPGRTPDRPSTTGAAASGTEGGGAA